MLNVHDPNEEFEVKSLCLRKKSLDFKREKSKAQKCMAHTDNYDKYQTCCE